ncbi:MAG: 50S ribosomal protein L23 [Candidatus Nomurabacteria bacterium]|nr:MAG: 50S ribosomal protein L23 [Candidatus Nomurabacteria bacterium]
MGIFDRFTQKQDKKTLQEKASRSERQKETVKAAAKRAEEEKKKSFQSVPAAGKKSEVKEEKKEVEKTSAAAPVKAKKTDTAAADTVLVRPIITEKAGYLSAKHQYIFEVHPQANKIMIQKAIEANYGVRPIRVNIITVAGREVRYGRTTGRTNFWKKAIVTLPKDKTIDVYEV